MYDQKKKCVVGRYDGQPISEHYLSAVRFRQRQLARNQTVAEKAFDENIASVIAAEVNTRLRRQEVFYIIDGFAFIADFYFVNFRTAVEIDGTSHDNHKTREKDAWRDEVLGRSGISVIRFSNEQVVKDMNGTFNTLVRFLATREYATPSHRKFFLKVYSRVIGE